jgi:hypothetical protein
VGWAPGLGATSRESRGLIQSGLVGAAAGCLRCCRRRSGSAGVALASMASGWLGPGVPTGSGGPEAVGPPGVADIDARESVHSLAVSTFPRRRAELEVTGDEAALTVERASLELIHQHPPWIARGRRAIRRQKPSLGDTCAPVEEFRRQGS